MKLTHGFTTLVPPPLVDPNHPKANAAVERLAHSNHTAGRTSLSQVAASMTCALGVTPAARSRLLAQAMHGEIIAHGRTSNPSAEHGAVVARWPSTACLDGMSPSYLSSTAGGITGRPHGNSRQEITVFCLAQTRIARVKLVHEFSPGCNSEPITRSSSHALIVRSCPNRSRTRGLLLDDLTESDK